MLTRALILKTAALTPVERTVRRTRLFRPLVKRFIAGDTLDEAIQASQALLGKGLRVSLDNLGENTHSEAEANSAKAMYIRMLDRIAQVPEVAASKPPAPEPLNISVKLTQCGLDLGEETAERILRDVLDVAQARGNFVRVDMEASEYTERTVSLMERVLADHSNTGTVLQSYLRRTDDDVERMIALKARTRLVKGAYLEPPTVAYPEKSKVDEAYVRQSKRLLKDGVFPAIATHDEKIIEELLAYIKQEQIAPERYEFQMLYGIRRDLQESLRASGHGVRVYVPFGDQWYAYFTRRLAERPANAMFILRTLFKR